MIQNFKQQPSHLVNVAGSEIEKAKKFAQTYMRKTQMSNENPQKVVIFVDDTDTV